MTKQEAKLDRAKHGTETAMQTWADLVEEGMRFGVLQLEATLALQTAILESRTPADLMRAQLAYAQKVIEHLPVSAGGLAGMPFKSAMELMGKALSDHARRYDDVPV